MRMQTERNGMHQTQNEKNEWKMQLSPSQLQKEGFNQKPMNLKWLQLELPAYPCLPLSTTITS